MKKRFYISLLFTFFPFLVFTQNIDSLNLILSTTTDNEKHIVYEQIGDVYDKQSNYSLAIKQYEESIALCDDEKKLTIYYNKIGRIYFYIGTYDKSIEYFNLGLKICERYNDTLNLSIIFNNIGIIYQKMSNSKKSIYYLEQALTYKQLLGDKEGIANVYNNLGNVYWDLNQTKKTTDLYNKALEIRLIINDNKGISISYNNLGLLYKQLKQYDKSIEYFNKSLDIKRNLNDKRAISLTLNNIAETLISSQQVSLAKEYSLNSLKIAEEINAKEQISNALITLSIISEIDNDFKNAYFYHKRYKIVHDSLFSEESKNMITEIETKYQLSKKNQKIELLKKENHYQKFVQRTVIIGVIIIFLMVISLIFILLLIIKNSKQKIKIIDEEVKIQKLNLEKNKLQIEKKDLENKELQLKLNYKKRELSTKALLIAKNSKTVLGMMEELIIIKKTTDDQTKSKINRIIEKYKISKNDFNWNEFEKHFESVHQSFYVKLDEKFPKLTSNERKLCAFIKLNLSNKEIATLTFKSPSTIKTARKRLRKKLNLVPEDNIISFLTKFS